MPSAMKMVENPRTNVGCGQDHLFPDAGFAAVHEFFHGVAGNKTEVGRQKRQDARREK